MDKHPIQDCPVDKSILERMQWLEIHTAKLWDQVWWLSLPFWRRWSYQLQGFKAPLKVSWFSERSEFYNY